MRDTELYQHLLGVVAPWTVRTVELSVQDGRVDVWVEHPRGTRFGCPECERELSVYDHCEERAWRHLDSCAFLTFLHASAPQVACPEHGVRQVRLPWAEPHSRFTVLFERLAIDVLAACDVAAAAKLLRISWDEAWHLMDRAVARGLAAKPLAVPAHVGVDEKAAGKGQDYITVVSDLDAGTVEFVADERRQASLDGYFEKFTDEQLAQIQAVAMDMWEPFAVSVRTHLTDADDKIVFDRYHLMGYLTKAVDTVRNQNRALRSPATRAWPARSTCGCTRPRTFPSVTRTASPSCGPVTSRPPGRGRSRRACATSGPTSVAAGAPSTSNAGTSGQPTAAWSRSSTQPRPSNATSRGCCPTSRIRSPTPAPKASTPASKPSASPPAATATASTSRPQSTSTSADYSSTRSHHDPQTSRKSPDLRLRRAARL